MSVDSRTDLLTAGDAGIRARRLRHRARRNQPHEMAESNECGRIDAIAATEEIARHPARSRTAPAGNGALAHRLAARMPNAQHARIREPRPTAHRPGSCAMVNEAHRELVTPQVTAIAILRSPCRKIPRGRHLLRTQRASLAVTAFLLKISQNSKVVNSYPPGGWGKSR